MFEQESLKIWYEVCRWCYGIYRDHEEAALATKYVDPTKWLRAVLR